MVPEFHWVQLGNDHPTMLTESAARPAQDPAIVGFKINLHQSDSRQIQSRWNRDLYLLDPHRELARGSDSVVSLDAPMLRNMMSPSQSLTTRSRTARSVLKLPSELHPGASIDIRLIHHVDGMNDDHERQESGSAMSPHIR